MGETKIWKKLGFKRKADLESRIRDMVASYRDGQFISAEDEDFMMSIFENHHEWDLKRGPGIKKIRVDKARIGVHGKITRCFYIHRVDGTEDDISWSTSLKAPTRQQDFERACRFEIEDQRVAAREVIDYGVPCEVCLSPLTPSATHIDHAPPMTHKRLVEEFIRLFEVDVDTVVTVDAVTRTLFEDRKLAANWSTYHQENAVLRPICKRCNLSRQW